MLEAIRQPTFTAFLHRLQLHGTIQFIFGGLGQAKCSVELQFLERLPQEEIVRGGPGYVKEISEVLASIGVIAKGATAHRRHLDAVGAAIAQHWEVEARRELEARCTPGNPKHDPLSERFRHALERLLVRPLLHKEVENISCEARRWRVGFWAAECVVREDTGRVYKPRCYRRERPAAARPSAEVWAEATVGVPRRDASGVISMEWCALRDLAPRVRVRVV